MLLACSQNGEETVLFLIANGCDIETLDVNGFNARMVASVMGHHHLVEILDVELKRRRKRENDSKSIH